MVFICQFNLALVDFNNLLIDDKGKMKNVVFIDKALPPKSVNQREKMYRYFKKVVKQFVLKDGSMTPTSTAGKVLLKSLFLVDKCIPAFCCVSQGLAMFSSRGPHPDPARFQWATPIPADQKKVFA